MDRRLLATVGLVALVLLAGCSYNTTIAVLPEVDRVGSSEGVHEVQVTVNPNLGNVDENVSDVVVNGYSLEGERVCSADFGDIADRETRTLECEAFPSLLVADTPDRGEDVEPASDSLLSSRPPYTIVPMASLYRGHWNGSHQFDLAAWLENRTPEFNITDGRAVPTDGTLQTMQCRQWRQQRDGRDFSALADAPWLEWELRTLEGEQDYSIGVSNYSRHQQQGRTDRFDLERAGNTTAESDVPTPLAMRIWRKNVHSASSLRSNFHEVVDGLSRAEVNASENVTAAMRGIEGRYRSHEDTRIDCRATPSRQSGERRETVETFVSLDGYTYFVRLKRIERFEGDAFENVTAS